MFEGLVYKLVYNLERHWLFNIRLRHWLILLCFVLPVVAWLGLWGISRLVALPLTLGAAGVLVAIWWADRQRYMRFEEHTRIMTLPSKQTSPDTGELAGASPLPAMSKVRVYATGFFEVSGMRRYFVETPTDYTTFETREHCLMTQVPLTRFLLMGRSRTNEVGWWYTFFQPGMIRSIKCGWLHFGLRPRPALRLEIARPEESEDECLHLSFEDEATRALVLADLQLDAQVIPPSAPGQ
ncbi:MAG: hypothetical protein Kow0063_44440 [Anaerolineae bacterium]